MEKIDQKIIELLSAVAPLSGEEEEKIS